MEYKASASWNQSNDISTSFDASGGNYLVAFVLTSVDSDRPVSTVEFDNVEFTQVLSTTRDYAESGETAHVYIYVLPNPATGSKTFEVNTTGSTTVELTAFLVSISGANTSNAVADYADGGEVGNTDSGHDPTITLTVTQTGKEAIAILFGIMKPNTTATNYHTPGTGFTEILDTQGAMGSNNHGRYGAYRVFSGSGDKTVDDGDNNYDSPGPGAPRTHLDVAVLINGSAPAAAQIIQMD